jgi:hypothetical protein
LSGQAIAELDSFESMTFGALITPGHGGPVFFST